MNIGLDTIGSAPPNKKTAEVSLSEEQFAACRSASRKAPLRARCLFSLISEAGLLISQALELGVAEVSGPDGKITAFLNIPGAKGGLPRRIELSALLRFHLGKLVSQCTQRGHLWLFQSREGGGVPLSRSSGSKSLLRPIFIAAGMSNVEPSRALRKMAVQSFHQNNGGDIEKTMAWAGFKDAGSLIACLAPNSECVRAQRKGSLKYSGRKKYAAELSKEFERENEELRRTNAQLLERVSMTTFEQQIAPPEEIHNDAPSNLNLQSFEPGSKPDLLGVASALAYLFPERILFTDSAIRSLRDSPFTDVVAARECLSLLVLEFWTHFSGSEWECVERSLVKTRVQYNPSQSPQVIGSFPQFYRRLFNGKKYSLNKHLKLGNSRDPKFCFRVYFEWIPDLQKIVVFHAGRHGPCQLS